MKRFLYFIRNIRRFRNYIFERLRYLNLTRLLNLFKVEYALFFKKAVVNAYPYELIIDSTNICHLHCPLCPTGSGKSPKKRGHITLDTFKKIIDELGPYALHVYLHNWGESLLHREIINFISYAKSYRTAVSLSTNLSFHLSEERADSLIASGLDTLVMSIDGTCRETYSKYRVGGDFDLVIKNVRLLVERKRLLKSSRPFLEWQFLKMRHNVHEINRAREMAKEIGVDSIVFGTALLPFGVNDESLAREWMPEDDIGKRLRYDLLDTDTGSKCWWLWKMAVFSWDGAVSPCCYVDEESAVYGSINETSFMDIWNSPAYVSARRLFSGEKNDRNIVCNKCGVLRK